MNVKLNTDQRIGLMERIDELLENTEDWDGSTEEFNEAITFWTDILRQLGFATEADKLDSALHE